MALAAMALLTFSSATADAQQTVAPVQLFRGTKERDSPWLSLLREASAQGSQEKLVSVITEFLADLSKAGVSACCDQNQYVFSVVFLASEAADAPLVRVLVYKNGLSRGSLPGIKGPADPLYEVFVAEDLGVKLDSVYQSEPLEDPLAKESGEFVRLVFGKLALPVGSNLILNRTALTPSEEQRKELKQVKPPLAVTLSRIDLPHQRAKITINHSITVSDPSGHMRSQAAYISDSVTRTAIINRALERTTTTDPSCSEIAAAIQKAVDAEASKGECAPLAADPAKCLMAVKEAVGIAYLAAAKQHTACKPADAFPLARRFVSLLPEKFAMSAKGSTTLMNTPETHWAFGLSTGFIGGIKTDNDKPRAKISNGKIVVDPFSRLLAMGIVSWIPGGYDPSSVVMTSKERFRVFGGVAFAPHFGGTGGVAWAFNRYLGVNVGYAYLVYDTPKEGEKLDSEPTAENKAAPFDLAGTSAWFIGLTYNLK